MAAKSAKKHESRSENVTALKKRITNMVQLPRLERTQQSQIGRSWRNSLRSDFRVELRYLLRHHLWIFPVTTLASMSLAVLYLLTTPTLFTAHVQLLLDPKIPMPLPSARNEDRIIKEFDNPEVESQLGILLSAHIRQSVVNKLKLHENPEFTLETGHSLRDLFGSLWGSVAVGENEQANSAEPQPQAANPDPAALRAANDYLRDGLEVERVKLSYILNVSFTSLDPETAALVANSVADTYIGEQLTTSSQIASQGAKWLEERIDQLRRKVNEASFKLQEFRARRSDVVSEQTTIDELEFDHNRISETVRELPPSLYRFCSKAGFARGDSSDCDLCEPSRTSVASSQTQHSRRVAHFWTTCRLRHRRNPQSVRQYGKGAAPDREGGDHLPRGTPWT